MIYPCKDCLIQPTCSEKCVDYIVFVNSAADNLGEMSADEISYIVTEVPLEVRKKIERFIKAKIRYGTDRGIELYDFRKKELTECPSDTLARIA